MDDISLREDILDELSFEPSLDAVNIGVTVERGVRGVTNLISVRAPLDVGDIRSHIEGALKRSAEVEAHAIRVGVEGGKVTLEG
ncbi:MAG TPA: BON domain-containing protein, partial [Gammaproteobacteria bacterium]|nr:BON domain-containing protein [Gammaproteobacteria bacterium]